MKQRTRSPGNPETTRHLFRNRREAGRILAGLLTAYRSRDDVVVLGLASGGIPVAWEVATALDAPLDAFVVRKLGAPGHEELAVGALASGGRVVVDDAVRALRVSPQQLRDVAEREARELIRREATYRDGRRPAEVAGKSVILVDDGLSTGVSMLAAVQALRDAEPAEIVVAVPAAPESTCREFAGIVDEVVCATMPTPFLTVGQSFWDFSQVSDQEVGELLATPTTGRAASPAEESAAAGVIGRVAVAAPRGVPRRAALAELIGDASIVLIGESSPGTDELHRARAEITKWLIADKGFCAVAAEADWPAAYRINRYVRGVGADDTPEEALRGFERFPAWTWRNVVVLDFVQWLREHNDRGSARGEPKVGFYGLDLYRLHRSMRAVIAHLDIVDPVAAARACQRYGCFDHVSADDGQPYGLAAAFGAGISCERKVIEQLVETQKDALRYARRDGLLAEDELFYAQQNAQTVRNAEAYYRAMFGGRVTSWNLRDTHMAHTLIALRAHLGRYGSYRPPPRIVVWAHNSHVGDARATERGADGQLTLGQLVRERYGDDCRLIGFSTYTGTVTAAGEWGGVAERKAVRPALAGSVEELFHETGRASFLVPMRDPVAAHALGGPRLGRAIGVVYQPTTERQSHYYHVRPADQFDAIIHIETTTALEPLELSSEWIAGQTPATYPGGLERPVSGSPPPAMIASPRTAAPTRDCAPRVRRRDQR